MSKNEQFLSKMSRNQREEEILALLKENHHMTVEELAERLYISPSSIRRDLSGLQQQGYLRRFHGGAEILSHPVSMSPFSIRNRTNRKEKMAIVRNAASLIEANSSIFIDSSSTAMCFSQFLHPKLNITIYTNNMQLAYLLVQQKIRTYLVGGLVSEFDPVITVGSYALEMLKQIYVDQMFFTSSALNEEGEISDTNEEETAVRKLMLTRTKERIFLCAKERFGQISPHKVASLKDMDFLVSDEPLPEEFTTLFHKVGFVHSAQISRSKKRGNCID